LKSRCSIRENRKRHQNYQLIQVHSKISRLLQHQQRPLCEWLLSSSDWFVCPI